MPLNKRQQQALQTRAKILEIGRDLLRDHDFEQVTIQDIVEAGGIARGTFYLYFKSKYDLFTAVEQQPYLEILDAIGDIQASASLAEKLTVFVRGWFRVRDEYGPNWMRHWLRYNASAEMQECGIEPKMEYQRKLLLRYMEESVEKGELRPETPVDALSATIIFVIFGSSCYCCNNQADYDRIGWEDAFPAQIEALLKPWLC